MLGPWQPVWAPEEAQQSALLWAADGFALVCLTSAVNREQSRKASHAVGGTAGSGAACLRVQRPGQGWGQTWVHAVTPPHFQAGLLLLYPIFPGCNRVPGTYLLITQYVSSYHYYNYCHFYPLKAF